jgi:hypothetical protein
MGSLFRVKLGIQGRVHSMSTIKEHGYLIKIRLILRTPFLNIKTPPNQR